MYQHLLSNQYNKNSSGYYLNERSMSVPHLIYNNYNQIPIQLISPIHSPLYNQYHYQYHSPLLHSPRFIREDLHNKANSHSCKNKGCNGVKHSSNVKKMKLKQINHNSTVIDKTQVEVVKDVDDDKYVLINKNTLKEIIDNKLKTFEQKQQNDCNYIAKLISKENEAIPHIIKAVPKLIEMKIKENEQRKQIEKLKEEKLLFKIKQDFRKQRNTILQQYTNKSFQIHQITQLPSLYIEAKHKPIVDVGEIVKEKLIEHAIRKTMMKDKERIREYIAKDVLGKEKKLSKSERHMKELYVKEVEIDSGRDVNEISSKMEKKVKFKDNKKLPMKMLKDKSESIEEDCKNSRNKKKSKKEKIINDNNIKQQLTLTNNEHENDDDDNNNKKQLKEKKRTKKKKK